MLEGADPVSWVNFFALLVANTYPVSLMYFITRLANDQSLEETLLVVYDGMAKGGSAPTKHFVQALRVLATHENDAEFPGEEIAKKIEEAGYILPSHFSPHF